MTIDNLSQFDLPHPVLQGFRVDVSCKQLTVDFVNQSMLQIGGQDTESKRSDKTDFAERLGSMNRRWQILQGRITERVRALSPWKHGIERVIFERKTYKLHQFKFPLL